MTLEGGQAAALAIQPVGESGQARVGQLLEQVRHVAHCFGGGRDSMA